MTSPRFNRRPPRTTAGRGAAYPTSPRRPGGRNRLLAGAIVALVGLLAGCGLRLETPPPDSLTPDVNEVARQRASADAVGIEVLAGASGGDPADATTAIRSTVTAAAGEHLDHLGGIYRSGLATPTPSEGSSPAVTGTGDPAAASTDAVLAQLALTAANARADALVVPDGALARLLASVSAARFLLARQLAVAAGLPAPDVPAVTAGATPPAGVAPSAISALVAGEDEAGYGFEVIAAKLADAARASALARAAVHRARAEHWATLAEISRTDLDPRRTAYALPAGLDDPAVATALAQTMEQSLAASYASLVADAEPASRAGLIDAIAEATAQAAAWGAPIPPFPGLPERLPG